MITLIESKTDINCIEEGIISTQYYEKKLYNNYMEPILKS